VARPEIAVGSVRSKQPINPILRVAWMEFRLMNRNRFVTSVFGLLSSHTKLTSIQAPATTARTLVQRNGLERWPFFSNRGGDRERFYRTGANFSIGKRDPCRASAARPGASALHAHRWSTQALGRPLPNRLVANLGAQGRRHAIGNRARSLSQGFCRRERGGAQRGRMRV